MPRHPVLLPQPPIVLKPWSLESGALALPQLSSNIRNIQLSTFPTIRKHVQKNLKRMAFETRVTTKILEND